MAKILVTGGAGFIGSNFVNDLLKRNDQWSEILIIDALTYAGNRANIQSALVDKRVKFIEGSITDTRLVDQAMQSVHTVVHFAAETHVDRSISEPNTFILTNVLGTATLLKCALVNKVKKFLHVSTDEVYGSISTGSWNEDSQISPNSPYSASKASSDLLTLAYFRTFELPIFISRCSNNFGQYQYPEKFIPLAILNLLKDKEIPIYGSGLQSRDWLHVADHCKALNLILEKGLPGEVYNIGGGVEMTNLEMAKLLINILQKDIGLIKFIPDRKGHDFRYSVDDSKISKQLGYSPSKNFYENLEKTIDWYKRNQDWWGLESSSGSKQK
jgi:dTDP-glucose 4,6-dehydratase